MRIRLCAWAKDSLIGDCEGFCKSNVVMSFIIEVNICLCYSAWLKENIVTLSQAISHGSLLLFAIDFPIECYTHFIAKQLEEARKIVSISRTLCTLFFIYLQEINDTLDKEAVYRCMGSCFEISQPERPKLDIANIKSTDGVGAGGGGGGGKNIGITLRSAKNLAKMGTQMLASKLVS